MASSSIAAEATPSWQELPRDLTAAILQKLGLHDKLTAAQYVCTTWRSVCQQEPSLWRSIDMREITERVRRIDEDKLCRHVVDLSQGQLIDIYIVNGNDDMLLYVSQRSSQLRCLRLSFCYCLTGEGLVKAIKNFPLLEELSLQDTFVNVEALETVGRSCPLLKSFTLKDHWYEHRYFYQDACDMDALAIAGSMPGLCHLRLRGNRMTNVGLKAILEGCPRLKYLDLRRCFNIRFGGEVEKLCSQKIEDLRPPHDPMDDCDSVDSTPEDEYRLSDFYEMVMPEHNDYLALSGRRIYMFEFEE